MKMDHLDNWIQRGLEAKAEQMNVSEDMEPRVLQAVSARKREEHGRMKGFGKKIAAVAAAACLSECWAINACTNPSLRAARFRSKTSKPITLQVRIFLSLR